MPLPDTQDAAEPPKEALWQAAPGAPAAEAAAPASKAAHAAAKEAPRVLVGFSVPGCALALGEHLRVVGSCPELGGWDPAAAPPLAWHEGHRWAGEVPLPPGQHAWKLVVLRPDGGQRWEEGANRELRIPELAAGAAAVAAAGAARAAAAAAAGPLLRATARFGDTTATAVAADHSKLHVSLMRGCHGDGRWAWRSLRALCADSCAVCGCALPAALPSMCARPTSRPRPAHAPCRRRRRRRPRAWRRCWRARASWRAAWRRWRRRWSRGEEEPWWGAAVGRRNAWLAAAGGPASQQQRARGPSGPSHKARLCMSC